jgi:hypothetical protein
MISIRPINERGERIPPSEFDHYRGRYDFSAPLCLCPLLYRDTWPTNPVTPPESSVFVSMAGPSIGEYIAECSSRRCGYFGTYGSENWVLTITF